MYSLFLKIVNHGNFRSLQEDLKDKEKNLSNDSFTPDKNESLDK